MRPVFLRKLSFAVLAAAFALVSARGADTLTMATEATFPPYEFLRGQEVVGVDVELSRAVAKKLGR